ncbi:hypothetical protein AVEN_135371-1 [Araneus ventricosus]|uniref:Tesmin/TSO1-like CXC domain-containing protein n=1 Tax=Araneus ventricosus TaxID=182803 RepID=A0A4Y2K236_ARAVE|nr:hypothetical protein AVEN_135371-1 [Araneus ventricosus]
MKRTSREIIFNESTVLLDSQRQFLSNLANKDRFISQLASHEEKVGICTLIATNYADVHIVKTAIETYEKIKKQVLVIGQDIDLLVLLTALTPDDMDILMLKEGKGKVKDRFYSSKDLQNFNLVIDCKKSILFLHAISGCDTTSGFYGKGKLQAVQLFNSNKYLQDIPEIFSYPKSSYTDIERSGEKFIIVLYSNTKKKENSLNKMSYDCFNKLVGQASSAILLSKLPPTTEAAHQHCRRTFHQVQTWLGECLNPSGWGWKLVNKSLTPIYTTKGSAPAKIVSLITCGCNKGCGKKCVRANLRCTTSCRNFRG